MFKNIGRKFMTLAKVMFWVMFGMFITAGLVMIILGLTYIGTWYDELVGMYIGIGFGVMGGGFLLSWLSCWGIYSWGNLVDNVQAIRNNCCGETVKPVEKKATTKAKPVVEEPKVAPAPVVEEPKVAAPVVEKPKAAPAPVVEEPKPVDPRVKKLDMLLANGLITEEEYKRAVSNL